MNEDAEFFIGWQGRAPPRMARRLVRLTAGLALVAVVVVAGFAAWQRTIGRARWNYGEVRAYSGRFLADPVPTLLLAQPETESGASQLLLVRPGKFGFAPDRARALDGQVVQVRGSLLTRDGHAMLDVDSAAIVLLDHPSLGLAGPVEVDFGEHALQGEIVDSKCFLGAMNPGVLKPHRACAIRCISGGVPPVLLVRDTAGFPVYYLLVGPEGEPINAAVLDFVAEPVEARGRVVRRGEQLFFHVPPDAIRRLP